MKSLIRSLISTRRIALVQTSNIRHYAKDSTKDAKKKEEEGKAAEEVKKSKTLIILILIHYNVFD